MHKKWAGACLLATGCLLPLMPQMAEAKYTGETDAGINYLDFVENEHREARENQITEDQAKLAKDAADMKAHLRYPIDPKQPMPASFEGDNLVYDLGTGEFSADGNVHILQVDGHRYDTKDKVYGNTKKQEVHLPGTSHVLQYMPQDPSQHQVDLWAKDVFYQYGARTGVMGEAKGKFDREYVTGRRFEVYPDKLVVYDGTVTKCNAHQPDYHYSGDKIEYFTKEKKLVIHKARFWVKKWLLATKDVYRQTMDGQDHFQLPRVGYDRDSGAWIEYKPSIPLGDRLRITSRLYASEHDGGRSRGGLAWNTKDLGTLSLDYGYSEDGDDNWIKMEPQLRWDYGAHLKHSPFSYHFSYSIGRWHDPKSDIRSTHQIYNFAFSRDMVMFHHWRITQSYGFSITKDGYNDSQLKGLTFDIGAAREINPRWACYTAVSYRKQNKENSLFDYGLDDYSEKLEGGLSYRINDRDRVAVGLGYDLEDGKLEDEDFYWFHDMHCAQMIVCYRERSSTWHMSLQFTPW